MESKPMYPFSTEAQKNLDDLRMNSSQATEPQARVFMIDKTTSEIIEDDSSDDVYTTLDQIAEVLPDTIPRFVVMSYPLELSDGRKTSPFVTLFYMPESCKEETKMMYAAAKEAFVQEANTIGNVFEVSNEDDILNMENVLKQKAEK